MSRGESKIVVSRTEDFAITKQSILRVSLLNKNTRLTLRVSS